MNPIFTVNYPELLVATFLQQHFSTKNGYSVLLPLSAQQKGYDLALVRRTAAATKVVTFQVKSSRTFDGMPGTAPRTGQRNFKHYMWLKTFKVPPEADFFVLIGQYATNPTSLKTTANLWQSHLLLFTQAEMTAFMPLVRQKKVNKADTHFGFGFDTTKEAFFTRGHVLPQHPDYSKHLFASRQAIVQAAL